MARDGMEEYPVLTFTLRARDLWEGERVEVKAVGEVEDGVIVVRAASAVASESPWEFAGVSEDLR